VPTTLLAQADSCIGSKSSINVGSFKNVVGTFTPPDVVWINPRVLRTLDPVDLRSGIGEMLKVHAVAGPSSFDEIAKQYGQLASDEAVLLAFIERSLRLKQRLIEIDEFDEGPRRVMNYGHSFGHAIESATSFAIPHGIAISIGMDMANFVAARLGFAEASHFIHMHPTLAANYRGFEDTAIPLDRLLSAMARDKKNEGSKLVLVLPDRQGKVGLVPISRDDRFDETCREFLGSVRHS
jgi:3-dehydroquinate synthase